MDEENEVILFAGSRSTGGFCVTRRGLLLPSALGHILTETPALTDGTLALPAQTMRFLQLTPGMELLSIRSKAFVSLSFTLYPEEDE